MKEVFLRKVTIKKHWRLSVLSIHLCKIICHIPPGQGLHFQREPKAQTKLVSALQGAIYDVIVDLRKDSPTYKQWQGYILSEENRRQLLVPKGFAHRFCTIAPHTIVTYKVDEYYSSVHDSGIHWNDKELAIPWPVKEPILSEKDRLLPTLTDSKDSF